MGRAHAMGWVGRMQRDGSGRMQWDGSGRMQRDGSGRCNKSTSPTHPDPSHATRARARLHATGSTGCNAHATRARARLKIHQSSSALIRGHSVHLLTQRDGWIGARAPSIHKELHAEHLMREVIRGRQRHSKAIRGEQKRAIKSHQETSRSIKSHQESSRSIKSHHALPCQAHTAKDVCRKSTTPTTLMISK